MRKFIIALAFVLSMFICVWVSADSDVVVSLQIDNPIMKINGISAEIDPGRGTGPAICDGRTLVPIRAIVEAFGGNVAWNGDSNTVSIDMNNDNAQLVIGSTVAYCNNSTYRLDVAPQIINGRTMLPLRFVAECFNLGVAWNGETRTVTVIRNSFDDAEYMVLKKELPEYSGKPYAVINNGKPYFKNYELIDASFEYYGELDELGRCDVCIASVAEDIMPTENRGDISSVRPTGWQSLKYDVVPGGYLYNRCHLIGYQLTGENDNVQNLITGTRYLNIEGMLPFENAIADYISATGNRVVYRVTPVFEDENLVAAGVLMEAYSIEDRGAGISFCVFCYNVQPEIEIDYLTGNAYQLDYDDISHIFGNDSEDTVYRTPTGKRYHLNNACGGVNSYLVTLIEALDAGLTPCQNCAQ